MASQESDKGSVKFATIDNADAITEKSAVDEKKLPTTSSVEQQNGLSDDSGNLDEKKNLTLEVAAEANSGNKQKKSTDNIEKENKHSLNLLATEKNEQDDNKIDKKENMISHNDSQSVDDKKDIKNENDKDSSVKGGSLKRKRKSLSGSTTTESPAEESNTRGSKRKKLKSTSDRFCWRCHKEGVDAHCTACPRSWHRKCIGGMPSSLEKWICNECVTILRAENAETRSMSMAQLSVDQLCMLLKHVVERLRDYPGSEPFCKAVDIVEVSNYLEYVIKPMDLSLLEANVRSKLYGSTDAFMADAKWIQHNCIVFNTCGGVYADTSKLTNAAKQLIKVARQEVSEIEACPDCYSHSRNLPRPQPTWFIEPCRRPHPLVWAKLKGFPFWPAKAMPRVNSQGHVDVRFFGEHDRAWVPPKDLYLYSEEPPAPPPRKRKTDMDECVREITRHCRKLALMFGQFKFAPSKVQYDPNDPKQIQLILPNYNPLEPNSRLPVLESASVKKKNPLKKRSLSVKGNKLHSDEATDNEVDASSKENDDKQEKGSNEATAPKVQKLDVDDTKNTQTNLDTNHSKLDNVKDQEVATVAQNKNMKNEKSKSATTSTTPRGNVSSANNVVENSSTTSPGSSDKSNLSKLKERTKSLAESLSTTPSASETSEVTRVRKRSLLKNIINPQLALSQTEKTTTKHAKSIKVYKPKTRMVDKLNAEKALKSVSASKENEKQSSSPNSSKVSHKVLNNKESPKSAQKIPEINITASPSTTPASSTKIVPVSTNSLSPDKSVLLFVVNNSGKNEVAKQVATIGNKEVISMQKETHLQKKESKARKTLHNKPRNSQIVQHSLPSAGSSILISPTKTRETSSTYQLPPPEAGPISARLHHDANELARRMGQLMEEAYKEAAQANMNGENGTAENHETTVFFLRMQIEHMKWQHQQQIAELKHNNDRILFEMRNSLETEKLRALEEVRRDAEEEKVRCIEEIKRKQWCANCGREAVFYCCWNTSYCDYPCQQSHWPTHMQTCSSQETIYSTATASPGASLNQQQSNNAITHNSANKMCPQSSSKLSGTPPS